MMLKLFEILHVGLVIAAIACAYWLVDDQEYAIVAQPPLPPLACPVQSCSSMTDKGSHD